MAPGGLFVVGVVCRSTLCQYRQRHLVRRNRQQGFGLLTWTRPPFCVDLADLDRRSSMDLAPHGAVLDRISFMMRRRPIFLGRMMGRAPQYFPLFEEALDRHGFALGAEVCARAGERPESVGRSGAGATGLWQFMYNTAQRQDLEINSWVDERRDPVAATDAACRFLKRLHEIYDGDWHLALAAYNAGPGNVNKAIRRSAPGTSGKSAGSCRGRRPNMCRPSWHWPTCLPIQWNLDWCPVTQPFPVSAWTP